MIGSSRDKSSHKFRLVLVLWSTANLDAPPPPTHRILCSDQRLFEKPGSFPGSLLRIRACFFDENALIWCIPTPKTLWHRLRSLPWSVWLRCFETTEQDHCFRKPGRIAHCDDYQSGVSCSNTLYFDGNEDPAYPQLMPTTNCQPLLWSSWRNRRFDATFRSLFYCVLRTRLDAKCITLSFYSF